MGNYHLNQFYKNVSKFYNHFPHPFLHHLQVQLENKEISLYNTNNICFHGKDHSLCKVYIYQLIEWQLNKKIKELHINENCMNINGIDVNYISTDAFIQINMDTHLNKERNACIDFIKIISKQKNVLYPKHIIIIWNIDKLNHPSQCRLRRIIEVSYHNIIFLTFATEFSKLIEPIQSRFMTLRTPCLSNIQKQSIFDTILNEYHDEDSDIQLNKKKFSKVILSESSTLEDVFLLSIIISINSENLTKHIKSFKFIETELNNLLKLFNKVSNVHQLIESTRNLIYKIIHYNINHTSFAKMLLNSITSICKLPSEKMHHIIYIITKFDEHIQNINICKIIHVYEYTLIEIFKVIRGYRSPTLYVNGTKS
jgi:hypothetical protein